MASFFNQDQSPLVYDYDIKFYFLDIEANNNNTFIKGQVSILAESIVVSLDTIVFELIDEMTVDSVLLDQISTSFYQNNNNIYIIPELAPKNSEIFQTKIYYHGQPPAGGFFNGISTAYSSEWDIHVSWTLSEPFNAKQWWPTKQVLEDKADSCWVFITTDSSNLAGSQGLLTNITELGNGKLRYEWKSRYPIDYYLISFAVADYQEYNIYAKPRQLKGDSILIQNFIYDREGFLGTYKVGIDKTVLFMELFCDLFGMYPFSEEKYGHCFAEIGGGMEHQTMTTIGSFGFGITAHELGHMWFGDQVTCASWSDIWINEGFSTYSDYLAHEYIAGQEYPQIWLEQAASQVLQEPGGSIYIPPDEIDPEDPLVMFRIFDNRLSYLKGAYIIHMLRFELQNDDLFFNILKEFQIRYADSVATGNDFLELTNEMSAFDYDFFFEQWYYGQGYPIYDIVAYQENEMLYLNVMQSASTTFTDFFQMLMEYRLIFSDYTDTSLLLYQSEQEMNFEIPVQKSIVEIQVDPMNHTLEKLNSMVFSVNENSSLSNLKIHPNPFNEDVHLVFPSFDLLPIEAKVFNYSGEELHRCTIKKREKRLNLSGLASGTYFIYFRNYKGQTAHKIIKH
ncbi:MAG: T9SS type A sorting domain-containing protein [Bacteroidales bacterium]|nr:T9SS type A sorting domain-containing protein [Bacteroidales bacterium]MCF8345557.1 T9SS type A sorting domain-containing protein [Bacteroidales bacterium]MCF8350724.1 T9SS type A sorting domain-containing protein [Bacteroidales bacterium]MCF8376311.1 T9SS type A sorting domain-containing protein [Bacteroidales bacterium]MCF8401004.1 T9SS type A sorting domain-containing protein [Bacteroidales bacterium]